MSEYLRKDAPLKELDLSNNRIENDGANYLADALTFSNTNLEKLSIKCNNISKDGLLRIFDALKYNSTLNCLFIWGNIFDSESGQVKKTESLSSIKAVAFLF